MQMRSKGMWRLLLLAGGLVVAFTLSAAAGIFSWRTEDGGHAFADDIDAVPERYRPRVVERRSRSISNYGRYSANDSQATARYADQLATRLVRLRALNRGQAARRGERQATASNGEAPDYLTVRTGSRNGGGVDISTPITGAEAPLEIDTVYMKRKNSFVTQPVRITRRGDKIISIEKPRNRQWNLADALDEEAVREQMEE